MQNKFNDGSVLVVGTVTKDAETKYVGAKNSCVTTFSLIAGQNKDTTKIFVNCKAWFHLAEYASGIQKGDSVCIIGKVEEREYNGKTYKTLVADWLSFNSKSLKTGHTTQQSFETPKQSDFEEVETEEVKEDIKKVNKK